MPHDERIHSKEGNKAKTGKWKRRRMIEDSLYESVMAELKAAAGTPAVPAAPAGTVPVPPTTLTWPEVNAKLTAFGQADVQVNMPKMTEVLSDHGIEGYPLLSTQPGAWESILSDLGIA